VPVAAFLELEGDLLAVFRVHQVLPKIAHVGVGFFIHADKTHLPRDVLAASWMLTIAGRGRLGNANQVGPDDLRISSMCHCTWESHPSRGFENHIRTDAVQADVHLVREACITLLTMISVATPRSR